MDTTMVTAEDIMTRQLAVTSPDATTQGAIERLLAQRVSGLPVIASSGEFVGRFSERSAIAALELGEIELQAMSQSERPVVAGDLLDRRSPVLKTNQDVFLGANCLIKTRVSGAPVVDNDGILQGVFSEQSVMHVFIGLCWEQMPSSSLTAWLDRHEDRRISSETSLVEILNRFQTRPYRRLMVLHNGRYIGQVTRRDALQAALTACRLPIAERVASHSGEATGLKTPVSKWMSRDDEQVSLKSDVLTIANQFLQSSARQLPVLKNGRLEGQISRSDLLRAVQRFFPAKVSGSDVHPLYLSSVNKRDAHAVM